MLSLLILFSSAFPFDKFSLNYLQNSKLAAIFDDEILKEYSNKIEKYEAPFKEFIPMNKVVISFSGKLKPVYVFEERDIDYWMLHIDTLLYTYDKRHHEFEKAYATFDSVGATIKHKRIKELFDSLKLYASDLYKDHSFMIDTGNTYFIKERKFIMEGIHDRLPFADSSKYGSVILFGGNVKLYFRLNNYYTCVNDFLRSANFADYPLVFTGVLLFPAMKISERLEIAEYKNVGNSISAL